MSEHVDTAVLAAGHEELSVGVKVAYAAGVVALVLGAGLMSGLTLGLLSLDIMDLEVLKAAGDKKQRIAAAQLIKLISKPHWLLCTLLLCNAGCMEGLPLLLDRLLDPVSAILLSVTAILVFGEIVPQAVCSRYGVAVGAACAPMVRWLMWVCSPITWPLGKLLDFILGHEEVAMKRKELKAMVTLHGEGAGLGGGLSPDEVAVIHGAMDLTSKTASAAMTPLDKVFMLSEDALLDEETVQQVLQSGHSRVPIYRGNDTSNIIGLVLVKELLQFWCSPATPRIGQLEVRHMPVIPAGTPMFDVLRLFQTGNSHMALLTAPVGLDIEQLRRAGGRLETAPSDAAEALLFAAGGGAVPATQHVGNRCSGTGIKDCGHFQSQKPKQRCSWKSSFSSSSRQGKASCSNKAAEHQQQEYDVQQQAQLEYVALNVIQSPAEADSLFGSASSSAAAHADDGCGGNAVYGVGTTKHQQPLVPVGIITLEDVMEELLQAEIIDETDKYIDNEQTESVDLAKLMDTLPPHLHHLLRAEMLAAAQHFIQTSQQWLPQVASDLRPNAALSPTAASSMRPVASMRSCASTATAALITGGALNSGATRGPYQLAGSRSVTVTPTMPGASRFAKTARSIVSSAALPGGAVTTHKMRFSDPGYACAGCGTEHIDGASCIYSSTTDKHTACDGVVESVSSGGLRVAERLSGETAGNGTPKSRMFKSVSLKTLAVASDANEQQQEQQGGADVTPAGGVIRIGTASESEY